MRTTCSSNTLGDTLNSYELLLPLSRQVSESSTSQRLQYTKLQEDSFLKRFAVENMNARDQTVHKAFGKNSAETKFLTAKLEEYPLPRNMGPVVPPIDRKIDDMNCERDIIDEKL